MLGGEAVTGSVLRVKASAKGIAILLCAAALLVVGLLLFTAADDDPVI